MGRRGTKKALSTCTTTSENVKPCYTEHHVAQDLPCESDSDEGLLPRFDMLTKEAYEALEEVDLTSPTIDTLEEALFEAGVITPGLGAVPIIVTPTVESLPAVCTPSSPAPETTSSRTPASPAPETGSSMKRSASEVPLPEDGKRRKRQKKVVAPSGSKKITSFGTIPLTTRTWPERMSAGKPKPGRVFYVQKDPKAEIEVYTEPHWSGLSIVQFAGAAYEKRLNMSVPLFKAFQGATQGLITHHERVERDAQAGLLSTNVHIQDLDSYGHIQALVNMFKGRALIHIGTSTYVNEIVMSDEKNFPRVASHEGNTISIGVVREMNTRIGRILENFDFTGVKQDMV
jgi:hypothetical protein